MATKVPLTSFGSINKSLPYIGKEVSKYASEHLADEIRKTILIDEQSLGKEDEHDSDDEKREDFYAHVLKHAFNNIDEQML